MKKESSVASLRSAVDRATGKLVEAEAADAAERAKVAELAKTHPLSGHYMTSRSSLSLLLHTAQDVKRLEAEEAFEVARFELAVALDALELAENDELARQRDSTTLFGALGALENEEAALNEKLAELNRRRVECIRRAYAADEKHAARRVAEGLPTSIPLPRGIAFGRATKLLQDHSLKDFRPSRAESIKTSRQQVKKIAAELERDRIVEERAKAEAKIIRTANAQNAEREARERSFRERTEREEREAEIARNEKMASDFLARVGVSA
jgi:hypothetical protein